MILVPLIVAYLVLVHPRLVFYFDPWPGSVLEREPNTLPPTFESLWELQSVYIPAEVGSGYQQFLAEGDALFFLGSLDARQQLSLISFELATSRLRWMDSPSDSADNIVANSDLVLASDIRPGYVTAYEQETGHVDWRKHLRGMNIGQMALLENRLYVESNPTSFYVLSARSGAILDAGKAYLGFPIFYSTDVVYSYSGSVWATDLKTNRVLWQTQLDDRANQAEAVNADILLIRTGWGGQLFKVHALDATTGAILWQTEENIVSNFAIDGGLAYFLTENAVLRVVEPETGDVIDKLQFQSPEVVLQSPPTQWRAFYVAASESIVVVYFGDGRQLLAYRHLRDRIEN